MEDGYGYRQRKCRQREKGRADPNVPRARYQEIANAIEDEKQGLRNFLMGDHEFGDLEYEETALRFLGRIGHLIGYNAPLQDFELFEVADVEAAEEAANALI